MIFLSLLKTPTEALMLGADTVLCEGETLILDATILGATAYEWQDGATGPVYNVVNGGTYAVSVTVSCGELTDEVTVEFDEVPNIDLFPADTTLCGGESYLLDATVAGAIGYEWSDGSTEPTQLVTQAGDYAVTVTFNCGELNDAIEVSYSDFALRVDFGPDTLFCFGDSIILDATQPYSVNYLWQDGSVEPRFVVRNTGEYRVIIDDGCKTVEDVIYLEMVSCCEVFVPNVFSPNFDGTNDEFTAFSNCELPNFRMKVFNRWGALLYETVNQYEGWNGMFKGKSANPGVYVWLIEYNDGIEDQQLSGDLTLVK